MDSGGQSESANGPGPGPVLDSAPALVSPPATPEQAAAIAAAVQRFQLETAPPAAAAPSGPGSWLEAALLEGVSAKDRFGPGDPGALA